MKGEFAGEKAAPPKRPLGSSSWEAGSGAVSLWAPRMSPSGFLPF